MLPDDPRERAAIHEAGHVVVSLALRTGVRRSDILRRAEDHEGLTKYRRPGKPYEGSPDVLRRRFATALGGMAAVWLASGRQHEHRFSPGDMFRGLTYVCELVGASADDATAEACWDDAHGQAVAILEARWAAVEAIAAALVSETVVYRPRLVALYDAAAPDAGGLARGT